MRECAVWEGQGCEFCPKVRPMYEVMGETLEEEPWPDELWKDMSTRELMRLALDVAGELERRSDD